MTFKKYKYLILSDLYRVTGTVSFKILLKNIFLGESYKYIFWMRTCLYVYNKSLLRYTVYPFAYLSLNRLTYKLGISIPLITKIGSGFYIGHFGNIVVTGHATIGKNCNLSHGVTIGQANRGKNKGYPCIKDNVYIGPGAKIIGSVTIGNNVAIGANCVVTNDIPDNAVVVGIPGKVISNRGSKGYINNTDYRDKLIL